MSMRRLRFRSRSLLLVCVGWWLATAAAAQTTIRQYQYQPSPDGKRHELALKQVPRPAPGRNEVLVRIHATSLNGGFDLVMRDRPASSGRNIAGGIPLADGAGEVIALGDGVTRFKVGDRVAGAFFQTWVDGDRPPNSGST